jgi:hypothetical protein
MKKKHRVILTDAQRQELQTIIAVGRGPARRVAHARILLQADASAAGPGWDDVTIVAAGEVSRTTVERVRQRCAEESLHAALEHRWPSVRRPRRLDSAQAAHLIALTWSEPPAGAGRWTLRLLAAKMVALE